MSLSAEAERALRDINPWWEPPHHVHPVPPDYERPQVAVLWAALSRIGVSTHILRGPRQVGKSTAMLQLVRRLILSGKRPVDIIFLRCDLDILRGSQNLLAVLNWYEENIRRTKLTDGTVFVFLDEVHQLSSWDVQVKHVSETYRPRMVLAGSSSVMVARGQHEILDMVQRVGS